MNRREAFFKNLSDPKFAAHAKKYIPRNLIPDLEKAIKAREKK